MNIKLLTITQAAEYLQISPDTLRRWEAKGIITPLRTEGGSRRYTLLDLKIAKLNKKKTRFSQIPTLLKEKYINHKRDFRIALLTSFLWISGLLIYNFLTPLFLRPTNPLHFVQGKLYQPEKQESRLKLASQTPSEISAIKVLAMPDPPSVVKKIIPPTTGSDLLINRFNNLPTLNYTDTLNQYYSLQPLPQNQISSLIKRT